MPTIYDTVTDQIVAALERGAGNWTRPWTVRAGDSSPMPQNVESGNCYRGGAEGCRKTSKAATAIAGALKVDIPPKRPVTRPVAASSWTSTTNIGPKPGGYRTTSIDGPAFRLLHL